jgi:hypothetical protein
VEIEFVGGPRDGDTQRFLTPPSEPLKYEVFLDPAKSNETQLLGGYFYDPAKAKLLWEPVVA